MVLCISSLDVHRATPLQSTFVQWDLNNPRTAVTVSNASLGPPPSMPGSSRGHKRASSATSINERPRQRLREEVRQLALLCTNTFNSFNANRKRKIARR